MKSINIKVRLGVETRKICDPPLGDFTEQRTRITGERMEGRETISDHECRYKCPIRGVDRKHGKKEGGVMCPERSDKPSWNNAQKEYGRTDGTGFILLVNEVNNLCIITVRTSSWTKSQ